MQVNCEWLGYTSERTVDISKERKAESWKSLKFWVGNNQMYILEKSFCWQLGDGSLDGYLVIHHATVTAWYISEFEKKKNHSAKQLCRQWRGKRAWLDPRSSAGSQKFRHEVRTWTKAVVKRKEEKGLNQQKRQDLVTNWGWGHKVGEKWKIQKTESKFWKKTGVTLLGDGDAVGWGGNRGGKESFVLG